MKGRYFFLLGIAAGVIAAHATTGVAPRAMAARSGNADADGEVQPTAAIDAGVSSAFGGMRSRRDQLRRAHFMGHRWGAP